MLPKKSVVENLSRKHADPVDHLRVGLRCYIEFGPKNLNHYTIIFIMSPRDSAAFERSLNVRYVLKKEGVGLPPRRRRCALILPHQKLHLDDEKAGQSSALGA